MNTAAHSRADLDKGLAAFEKVGKELGVIGCLLANPRQL